VAILAFLVEAHSGGRVEAITRTFGVDWQHLGAQIISFCILCAVLHRWAYQPILKMLDERRQQIALGQANAERIKAELDKTERMRREVLQKANAEAARLVKDAHAAAARVQERESQKAIAAAQQMIAKAQEAAAQEHIRMLAQVKQELGRLIVQTAATVTGKILTAEDQRRLAEETVRQLPS